jgi:hypothetical protein
MRRTTSVGVMMFLGCLCVPFLASPTEHPDLSATCELSDGNLRFIQKALAGWETASRDLLGIDPKPLPWILLVDPSCVWHLVPRQNISFDAKPTNLPLTFNGEQIPAFVVAHDGTVNLPDGNPIRVSAIAQAALFDHDREAYVVLAAPDLWHQDVKVAEDPNLDYMIFGLLSHEIVHTRQLGLISNRIRALADRYILPERIDDDIIEQHFQDVEGFEESYQKETDLFYQAVETMEPERRRSLILSALTLVDERRQRYFTDTNAFYAELEDIFLNMEGLGTWLAFRLAETGAGFDKNPRLFRWRETNWSHEQGLALFLLLESMVPSWQARILGPELPSPYTLLRQVLHDGTQDESTRMSMGAESGCP